MEYRACGNSGLELSPLGLGCWQFGGGDYWGESDQRNVTNIVHQAVDMGINYFDSAEVYNDGRSEEFLGRALRGVPRDKFVVGTKVWPTNMAPDALRRHCEDSLRRLDLDAIDIYMIHWPLTARTYASFADTSKSGVGSGEALADTMPSLRLAVDTLLDLQREGKIQQLGLSNYGTALADEILQLGGSYAVNELVYNLVTRAAEYDILPYCHDKGIGVIAYMVLMQGLLTDRYSSLDEIPDWYTRTRHFDAARNPKTRHGEPGAEPELLAALDAIRAIAADCGCSVPDLALRWAVDAGGITCALVGTQNRQRLEANVLAIESPLRADVIARLRAATEPLKEKLGTSLDVFVSAKEDRSQP